MKSELTPRPRFEEFLHRPRSAGQRYEPVREFRHRRFSFMHGVDDPKFCEGGVGDLVLCEGPRDHADHLPTTGKGGIG